MQKLLQNALDRERKKSSYHRKLPVKAIRFCPLKKIGYGVNIWDILICFTFISKTELADSFCQILATFLATF